MSEISSGSADKIHHGPSSPLRHDLIRWHPLRVEVLVPQPDRVRLPQHRRATAAHLCTRNGQRCDRLLAAIFGHLVSDEEAVEVDELLLSSTG